MKRKVVIPPALVYSVLVLLLVWLWEQQILLSLTLFALFLGGQSFWIRRPYDWMVYLVTVTFSLAVELICVHFGAWTYNKPNLWNIPSYIPFAYGVGILSLLKMVGGFCEIEAVRTVARKEFLAQLVGLGLLVICMASLWRNSVLLTIALVLLAGGMRHVCTRSGWELPFYAISFALAPIIDITNIARGVWWYGSDSLIWNIPMWLPFAYGFGLLLAVKIGLNLHRILMGSGSIARGQPETGILA